MRAVIPDGCGGARLAEVEKPERFPGAAVVRTLRSLISVGTELSMLGRTVGADPVEYRKQGFRLGYNAAGVVEEVVGEIPGLAPGDVVACYGGPYVEHASELVVPRRLLQKLPEQVTPAEGCFAGLGAIALHGFRCAGLALGETAVVAGGGVIGQLTAQLAALAGCRVVLAEPRGDRRRLVQQGATHAAGITAVDPMDVAKELARLSAGRGADAVFLAMGTASVEPVVQAFEWVRPNGSIVVLGDLPLHVPREAAFAKEARLMVSRAAGPGRYDRHFERHGLDYPVAYVRWTEERNCEEIVRLLGERRLVVHHLIGGERPATAIQEAYEQLRGGGVAGTLTLDWVAS